MELILAISGLIVFVVLAVRYGYDSREGIYSKEQELASYGLTWDELVHQQELAEEINEARTLRAARTIKAVTKVA